MELRLLLIAARLLDPRLWKRRLAQLGGGVGATLWVWYRSVDTSDELVAVRDAKRASRNAAIRSRLDALEAERYRAASADL